MQILAIALFVVSCMGKVRETVILHTGDMPYEIEWDGQAIQLNITSVGGKAFDAQLWRQGKIETYRGRSLFLVGEYKWLDLTSRTFNNSIKIKWAPVSELAPANSHAPVLNDLLCGGILIFKLLAIFQIRYAEQLFMLAPIGFALWTLEPENFVQRLLLAWSIK